MKPRAKLPKAGGGAKSAKSAKSKPRTKNPPGVVESNSTTTTQDIERVTPTAADQPEAEIEKGEQTAGGEGAGGEQGEVDDGTQARARMLQRHKQELREVKKVRGKSKAEVKKMEQELRVQQQAELHALDRELAAQRPKRAPKPLSPGKESSSEEDESSEDEHAPAESEAPAVRSGEQADDSKAPKKPSRAARRKQKREAEEREREKRIEEERKNAGPSAKALEIRRLMEKLGPKGFRIAEVVADGNCLYSAVGDQIKRSSLAGPQSIVELRRLAADYIMSHPDDFLPFLIAEEELPPEGLKKYCDELKRDGVWGGQLELRALAQSLKVPIVVHSADAPELKMGEEFERDPLQLTFHRHYYALGEHYNSVVANQVDE